MRSSIVSLIFLSIALLTAMPAQAQDMVSVSVHSSEWFSVSPTPTTLRIDCVHDADNQAHTCVVQVVMSKSGPTSISLETANGCSTIYTIEALGPRVFHLPACISD